MDAGNKKYLVPNIPCEDFERAAKNVGSSESELLNMGMQLIDWMHTQPHLPLAKENLYKYCGFIGRVVLRKKVSIERAKHFMDSYYTFKTLAPEYMMNRDPASPQLRASLENYYFAVMPEMTERKSRLYVGQVLNNTFSPHMMADWHKYTLMVCDVQQWDETSDGEEIIIDLANITLQHAAAVTPSSVKKLVVCYFTFLLFRTRSVHYVNVPSFIVAIFDLVKTLLNPKIANRLFVHTKKGYGTLHEHISPQYLPKDFGGDGPALKDVHDAWLEKLNSYRDWFLEQDNYLVQEELRPGKHVSHSDVFGMEGSFRKLTVD